MEVEMVVAIMVVEEWEEVDHHHQYNTNHKQDQVIGLVIIVVEIITVVEQIVSVVN